MSNNHPSPQLPPQPTLQRNAIVPPSSSSPPWQASGRVAPVRKRTKLSHELYASPSGQEARLAMASVLKRPHPLHPISPSISRSLKPSPSPWVTPVTLTRTQEAHQLAKDLRRRFQRSTRSIPARSRLGSLSRLTVAQALAWLLCAITIRVVFDYCLGIFPSLTWLEVPIIWVPVVIALYQSMVHPCITVAVSRRLLLVMIGLLIGGHLPFF